ncbi:hypothetical protein [Spartinivicinus ruber]|uniref:hypothetical protein n=1 Tax=Spartinivicinus ruber TaxID=2683272 RepID=UPI0013D20017|nr:hypothetical protein [Spartinivicinus ruber]
MYHCDRKHRVHLLNRYISRWLEYPKVSRQGIAEEVITFLKEYGYLEVLERENIQFSQTRNLTKDLRINAQKIFRWLGDYDEVKPSPSKLFFVEAAIVATMPLDLRMAYLNEVYDVAGVYIGVKQSSSEGICSQTMAARLTKENMEAQLSVIELGDCPTEEAVKNAHRELKESAATTQAAVEALETNYPFISLKKEKSC